MQQVYVSSLMTRRTRFFGWKSIEVRCPGFYSLTIWSYDDSLKCWVEKAKYLGRVLPGDKVEYLETYKFENLPPGRYGILAVRQVNDNVLVQQTEIDLQENQHASCKFLRQRGSAGLKGRISGYNGDISDLRVIVRKIGSGPIQFAGIYEACTRDSVAVIRGRGILKDGSFKCDGLPEGTYTITVAQFPPKKGQYRTPVQQVSKTVELRENKISEVDFELAG